MEWTSGIRIVTDSVVGDWLNRDSQDERIFRLIHPGSSHNPVNPGSDNGRNGKR
jgi:hypothetical protein